MLDVLADSGSHHRDWAEGEPPRRLRIGMTLRPPVPTWVHASIGTAVAQVAATLRAAGHTVDKVRPPWRISDATAFIARYLVGVADDAARLRMDQARLQPRSRSAVKTGAALRDRVVRGIPEHIAERYSQWFSHYDVLLTPTLAQPPLRVGAFDGRGMLRTMSGNSRFMPFTPQLNLVRCPAISVPAGVGPHGLPLGVQLAAAPGGEGLLLAVAAELERRSPWRRHPE
jgi:amidase